MLIREADIRKLVRYELLKEAYKFSPPYKPGAVVRIKGKDALVVAVWSAGRAKQYMVIMPKKTALKGDGVRDPTKKDMKFWKKDKSVDWHKMRSGRYWNFSHKRLGALRDQKRLSIITGASTASNWAGLGHFEPKSAADEWIQGIRDTFIEVTAATLGVAAAAAAAIPGAQPIAAALEAGGNVANVADVMNKMSQNNYLGAAFGILGLIPGGDTITILKKLGAIEDVVPSWIAKEIAELFVNLIDGDFKDTVTELVNAYSEKKGANPKNIMPKVQLALGKLKDLFNDIAEKQPKIKKA